LYNNSLKLKNFYYHILFNNIDIKDKSENEKALYNLTEPNYPYLMCR